MPAASHSTDRRRWWILFGLLSLLLLVQNLGTPRGASPDELDHLVRSAGIVRGQVYGSATDEPVRRRMDVPWWVDEPRPDCFAFQPEQPASCAAVHRDDTQLQTTSAAAYPPLAHVVAGVGTLAPFGVRNAWIARQLLAEACAALLASALVIARRRSALTQAAVWLATTPMVVFLAGTVNPSGLCACAAIALWVGLLDRDVGVAARSPGLHLAVLGAVVMLATRSDGLVFVPVIVALVGAWRGWPWLVGVARQMPVALRVGLAAVVIAAIVWAVEFPPELLSTPNHATHSILDWFGEVVSNTRVHLREAVGVLGWLDTPIPTVALGLWVAAFAALLVGALRFGGRRERVVLVVSAATVIVVPWAMELARVRSVGLYWQGRYGLPLFVGVVVLVGLRTSRSPEVSSAQREWSSRFSVAVAVVVVHGLVLVLSFAHMLRRFGVGASGSLAPWRWSGRHLPLPAPVLLAAYVVVAAALCVALTGIGRGRAASLADRVERR